MYLFDLDGTLIDSNGVWVEVDRVFLSRRGFTATPEYCHTVGHSIFPVAAQFTKDYYHLEESPQEIMDEWTALAGDAYSHHVPLKEGAREFLEYSRDRGEPMVLTTACVPQMCKAVLERHKLTPFFSSILFAQELGVEKRDPLAFPMLGRRLQVPLERCVFFDDSPAACASAKAAGLTVVGVRDDFFAGAEQEVRAASHRFITGFDQLLGEPFPPAIPGRTDAR